MTSTASVYWNCNKCVLIRNKNRTCDFKDDLMHLISGERQRRRNLYSGTTLLWVGVIICVSSLFTTAASYITSEAAEPASLCSPINHKTFKQLHLGQTASLSGEKHATFLQGETHHLRFGGADPHSNNSRKHNATRKTGSSTKRSILASNWMKRTKLF